jgi:hypothetical protein
MADQGLIDSSLGGLAIGTIISLIFAKNSKPTENKHSKNIFGTDSQIVIRNILAFVIIAGFTGLLGLGALNRDFEYISEEPSKFGTELILFATVPAGIIFVMTILRGHKISSKTWLEFGALAVKFGLMHILLQICGFYRYVYPPLEIHI